MSTPLQKLQIISKSESSHSTIATYLLAHMEDVQDMNIHELAKQCYTSAPSIVRMCKKMGYEGFAQFKLELHKYITMKHVTRQESYHTAYIYHDEKTTDIIRILTNISVNALRESTHYLDDTLITKIVDLLYQAERIDIYGAGQSNFIAKDIQYRFLRSGKNSTAFSETDTMYSQAQWANKKTVSIAVSYSGENENIIAIMQAAKVRGAVTISLTCDKDNTIASFCDYNLFVHSIENPDGYIAASSRLSMLHIMDIIFSVYASTYEEVMEHIAQTKPLNRKDK